MNITSEIETMILEMTRNGVKPRYIITGIRQYSRWNEELKEKGLPSFPREYMGCQVIICSSDIIEAVTDPETQYRKFIPELKD